MFQKINEIKNSKKNPINFSKDKSDNKNFKKNPIYVSKDKSENKDKSDLT